MNGSTHLKTATLLTSAASSNVSESAADPESNSVSGSSGTRMVFSCTWKENKKNDIEDDSRAYGNKGRKGGGAETAFFRSVGLTRSPWTVTWCLNPL